MTYTYWQNVGGDDYDDNDVSDYDDDGECGDPANHYNDDEGDDCDEDDDDDDGNDDDDFFTRRRAGVDSTYAAVCSDAGFELIRIGWWLIQPMTSSSRADSAAHSLRLLRAALCVSIVSR